MRLLRRDEQRVQAWKNGGGTSRLIACAPTDAAYDAVDWHVSRPSIAKSGPFSHLPGLDRIFMLVEGRGVTLHLRGDGAEFSHRVDQPLVPFAFRGDWDTQCDLIDGPAEVLSVFARRGRIAAVTETFVLDAAPRIVRKPPADVLIVYCPAGPVSAWGAWGTATLEHGDAIVADAPEAQEVALAGQASASPASQSVVIIRVSKP